MVINRKEPIYKLAEIFTKIENTKFEVGSFLCSTLYSDKNDQFQIVLYEDKDGKENIIPLHEHSVYTYIIVIKGQVTISYYDHDVILKENDIHYVFPNTPHIECAIPESKHLSIFIPKDIELDTIMK
ncbi:MAG: cupin domain-containing protein [Acidithiobacillus sp.]|jgi:quercetin dioxygenase-like cupin family protein|uniref:cupin domain-containing protein n=1 Tax=Acidithiobacillus sp. TaxID=1872118 RepID=UPI00355DCEE0